MHNLIFNNKYAWIFIKTSKIFYENFITFSYQRLLQALIKGLKNTFVLHDEFLSL